MVQKKNTSDTEGGEVQIWQDINWVKLSDSIQVLIVLFFQVFSRIEIFEGNKVRKRKNISCIIINIKTYACIKAIKYGHGGGG